ncbi:MAG TPA: hypothetical protein VN581_10255, partial [Patescibacteria group bacterium]|nr:hypothetical protein [Patescibacteria group bacterium]
MLANSIRKSIGKQVVAGAIAICASAGMIGAAHASVVNSGPVNIPIPDNIDGIYFNVITGASGPLGSGVAGWDVNLYSAVAGQFQLWGPTTNTYFNPQAVVSGNYNLPRTTVIQGAAAAFFRPGGSLNVGTQLALNSSENFIGFRFANESNGGLIHHGWAQLSVGAT